MPQHNGECHSVPPNSMRGGRGGKAIFRRPPQQLHQSNDTTAHLAAADDQDVLFLGDSFERLSYLEVLFRVKACQERNLRIVR